MNKLLSSLAPFILVAVLSGCSSRVEGWQIIKAQEFCSNRGGIDHINNGTEMAVCRDGKRILLHSS